MSKLNDLDKWLLENWTAACSLEQSLEAARVRYKSILDIVIERVQEKLPELDIAKINITSYANFGGHVGFSKKSWPSDYPSWPTGLWVGPIGLESLTAAAGELPSAYIWIRETKNRNFDLEKAKKRVFKSARKLLPDRRCPWLPEDNKWTCGYYDLPESREVLVKMLLEKNGEKFIKCLSEHFCRLGRFIPILDELLIE